LYQDNRTASFSSREGRQEAVQTAKNRDSDTNESKKAISLGLASQKAGLQRHEPLFPRCFFGRQKNFLVLPEGRLTCSQRTAKLPRGELHTRHARTDECNFHAPFN